MRPIDADKLEVVGGYVPKGYDVDSYLAGNREILEMIDRAPTLDAVEVIRCKDCKYWGESPYHHPIIGWCMLAGHHRRPEYYCADGRRKDDNDHKK